MQIKITTLGIEFYNSIPMDNINKTAGGNMLQAALMNGHGLFETDNLQEQCNFLVEKGYAEILKK